MSHCPVFSFVGGNQGRSAADTAGMSTRATNAVLVGIGLAAASLFAGCGSDDSTSDATVVVVEGVPLSIADPWSREPAEGQMMTAVYGVINNGTDRTLRIVGGSSPAADRVELHETVAADDGTMSMREREEGFVVPPRGELVLEPGGAHIMLFGIDPATYSSPVEVTVDTDIQDTFTFEAEVRAIGG